MVGFDLGKKERRYTSMIRITRGSSGGPLNTASPRQGKVPGKTSGRYLLLDVDPKRIAKLTTAYHFFHMSERIEILTRCRRFHQMLNFDNDGFLNLLLHIF